MVENSINGALTLKLIEKELWEDFMDRMAEVERSRRRVERIKREDDGY